MSDKHAFNRLTDTESAESRARQAVEELVARVKSVSGRLNNWVNVAFDGQLSDKTIVKAMFDEYTIIGLDEMPSLESIHFAIEDWRKASQEARAALAALTDDQLRTIGRSRG